MSPAVEQNIIKRMKKPEELILRTRMKGATISRTNWKKKESIYGLAYKSENSRSSGKLTVLARNNSAASSLDASPREMNKISPVVMEEEPTGIRFVAYPIATTVPFNRTLSTSTPDPEKLLISREDTIQSIAAVKTTSSQTITDGFYERPPPSPPPPAVTKVRFSKLQQIVYNQVKTAHRKTSGGSHFKLSKTKLPPSRLVSNWLKSNKDLQVPQSKIPSLGKPSQNAVSFSIHQVNKVTSTGQKLIPSQNSAFHQVLCNVPETQGQIQPPPPPPPPPFSFQDTANPQKMVVDPTKVQARNNSPVVISKNSHSIPITASQSDTNLFVKPRDIQSDGQESMSSSNSSPQPFLKDVPQSIDPKPFQSTQINPGSNFELYSQEERLPQSKQIGPLSQYANLQPITDNYVVMTAINPGPTTNASQDPLSRGDPKTSEFDLLHKQAESGNAFVASELSRHPDNQDLVQFEEPVRDSDVQAKSRSPFEYPSGKKDPLKKASLNVAESIALKGSESDSCVLMGSDDEQTKPLSHEQFSPSNGYAHCSDSSILKLPPLQWKSVEALAGVKTLRFMIKQLEEISTSINHLEVSRLVKQIQQVVSSLPQLSETFDLQTEINLALQPLRNENSHLRRRLRIVAEKAAQEKEEIEADQRRKTLELQLQLLNMEKRVDEEKLCKHQHLHQQEELVKELNMLKMERQCLVRDLGQRETSQFDMRRENWEESRKYLREIEILKKEIEQKDLAIEASEKKNHILQITVEQRDMEISRNHEILVSTREGMKEFFHNLCQSKDIPIPTERIEKFFAFVTQDPTSEDSSTLKTDSAANFNSSDKWMSSPSSSNKGSNANIQRAALENSVDKRLQTLLDMMKSSSQTPAWGQGTHPAQCTSSVSNPSGIVNSHKTKDLELQVPELRQTKCSPLEVKDSGCGASPDLENLYLVPNCRQDKTSTDLTPVRVVKPPADKTDSSDSILESSSDMTRASITDYFAKYPSDKPLEQYSIDTRESKEGEMKDDPHEGGRMDQDDQDDKAKEEEESKEQEEGILNAKQISNKIMQNILNRNPHFFTESLSELDASSLSQFTMTTFSSLTGDVRTFRQGLASLDANIARLQASIPKNKTSFST